MKVSLVMSEGVKQIMMTPETPHEKEALKYIMPDESYEVATFMGTYDDEPSKYSYNTSMSKAGYLRRFAEEESLMFVLKPKEKTTEAKVKTI